MNGGGGGDGSDSEEAPSRVQQALRARAQQMHEQQFGSFIANYPLNVLFPALVKSKKSDKPLRTDTDLVNARLIENGVLFQGLQPFPDLQEGIAQTIDNLMKTGCFRSVTFDLDLDQSGGSNGEAGGGSADADADAQQAHKMTVVLEEKNWYSLYIGGGLKHDGLEQSMGQGGGASLPKAQFETSATLLNLTGNLDRSQMLYTVDQTTTSSFLLSHERPLYAWFGEDSDWAASILSFDKGSQYALSARASIDTVEYDWTRSYREFQRQLMMRLDNQGRIARPEMAPLGYWGLDWSLLFRDIVPRKHADMPYAADASPEIVAQSGPSVLHSISWEERSNGELCDSRFQPTAGVDYNYKLQLAGPPGDLGFAKAQGGLALHVPLIANGAVALHGSLAGGIVKPISYNGLCKPPSISDRFFVGGPMQLRGFLPAGIGPRSAGKGGSVTPGGDALGGSLFYTASVAASIAPGGLLRDYGVRLFGFANAGTLSGTTDVSADTILRSSRVAAGAGISAATPMGRLEFTYAYPIRYGPRDARRNMQLGFGFNFG